MATYLLLDADGAVVEPLTGTLPEVVAELDRILPQHSPVVFDGDFPRAIGVADERRANPIADAPYERSEYQGPDEAMPELALEASGLPRTTRAEAEAMSEAEAYKRLEPFFEGRSGYRTMREIGTRVLTDNYKTGKAASGVLSPAPDVHPRAFRMLEKSYSKGLALLPFTLGLVHARKHGPLELRPKPLFPVIGQKSHGLCVGSTVACRQSCLVYSGQNEVVQENVLAKGRRTQALLREPVAFLKAVDHAIGRFKAAQKKAGVTPYVRLNIYSDIPWELVAPWLFEAHRDVMFYDYTKVAGRQIAQHPNYHLTFSYGGTQASRERMRREFSRGRQVTLVFNLARGQSFEGMTFDGHPIYDGDAHDIRSFDPSPAVIGLRYKTPLVRVPLREKALEDAQKALGGRGAKGQAKEASTELGRELATSQRARKVAEAERRSRAHFLVQVEKDPSTGLYITAATPRLLGGEAFEEMASPEGRVGNARPPKASAAPKAVSAPRARAVQDDTLS